MRRGTESRTATVQGDRDQRRRSAPASSDLVILKSSHSAFAGFLARRVHDAARDADRHPRHGADGDLAVSRPPSSTSSRRGAPCGTTLLETFAEHDSESVQHTLHAMGQAVLDSVDAVAGDPSRHAEQAPPARGPVALRPREPQRDLRADRRAARADRGDDRAVTAESLRMDSFVVRANASCCRDGIRPATISYATDGSPRSRRTASAQRACGEHRCRRTSS